MHNIDTLKKYVGKTHSSQVEDLVKNCDESKLTSLRLKSPTVALILSIFTGIAGIDRLYQGGLKMFGYKLAMVILTFGTWWLADIYYTKYTVEEANYEKLLSATA